MFNVSLLLDDALQPATLLTNGAVKRPVVTKFLINKQYPGKTLASGIIDDVNRQKKMYK